MGRVRPCGPIICCNVEQGAVLVHQSPAWGAAHVPELGAMGLCHAGSVGLQLSAPGCNRRLLEGEGAGSTRERGNESEKQNKVSVL